jgi:hypothetical protein
MTAPTEEQIEAAMEWLRRNTNPQFACAPVNVVSLAREIAAAEARGFEKARALAEKLATALDDCSALMVKPAHVFSCGAYNNRLYAAPVGKCTCGVDDAYALARAALAEYRALLPADATPDPKEAKP